MVRETKIVEGFKKANLDKHFMQIRLKWVENGNKKAETRTTPERTMSQHFKNGLQEKEL